MQILKKISNGLYTVSSGWVTLISLIIFLLFTSLVLPVQSVQANDISGDVGSPDTSFFYTPQDIYEMAEAYGNQGRVAYIQARFTFDLVWPLVYTFFLVTTISWLIKRVIPGDSTWRMVNLLPLWGMIADYLKNIATSIVMWRYPQTTPLLDWLAGIITTLKWLLISSSFIVLLAGLVLLVLNFVRKDRKINQ